MQYQLPNPLKSNQRKEKDIPIPKFSYKIYYTVTFDCMKCLKIYINTFCFFAILITLATACNAQKTHQGSLADKLPVSSLPILPGAYQLKEYLPLLSGKRVGIFANQTSTIGSTHLIDTLRKCGISISKIFAPEHGFRGNADAGQKVNNGIDPATGIKIVSLYGSKKRPSNEDLSDVDVLVFDIQDVGVRFYTFISSLQYFIESAIENKKPLIILDRPNPNGFYVDGPVLDTAYKSFVGMQPIPVVYGMTMGEYANYLVGEGKLDKGVMASLMIRIINDTSAGNNGGMNITVIKCRNYTHKSKYILPVKPSPNLPDMSAVYWYPTTCFFEGTVMSEGRGTNKPFQVFGHPALPDSLFAFTPDSTIGAANPKFKKQQCFGWNVAGTNDEVLKATAGKLQLKYLLAAFQLFKDKELFFLKGTKKDDYFFNKLAGNQILMEQIKNGISEEEIRKSWEPALLAFKKIRKKYLMYPDFE